MKRLVAFVIAGLGLNAALALDAPSPAAGATRAPQPVEAPAWFSDSFLDIRDEVRDAGAAGRGLLVYFGQDGCPYCAKMVATTLSQRRIAEKARSRFVAIALDIWGAREVTWVDGVASTEKDLARRLDVQFTPTMLFLDRGGRVTARLNGYYPPHLFDAVLDYAAEAPAGETLATYLARASRPPAAARLADEPFLMRPPYDLARRRGGRPLAAIFETTSCAECDELHRDVLSRADVREAVGRFDVARFALGVPTPLTTPDGRGTTADLWAKALGVAYTPTIVFFDDAGVEVFRIDAYFRAFHVAAALDYVASGAYRTEPSFQRFIQARSGRLRERRGSADLLE